MTRREWRRGLVFARVEQHLNESRMAYAQRSFFLDHLHAPLCALLVVANSRAHARHNRGARELMRGYA
jgi:hypothetical protein